MFLKVVVWLLMICFVYPSPEQGLWRFDINQGQHHVGAHKTVFAGTTLLISVSCSTHEEMVEVDIQWMLRASPCYDEYLPISNEKVSDESMYGSYFRNPNFVPPPFNNSYTSPFIVTSDKRRYPCKANTPIQLPEVLPPVATTEPSVGKEPVPPKHDDSGNRQASFPSTDHSLYTFTQDGVYLVVLNFNNDMVMQKYNATVEIKIKGTQGYLSAADWPLLPFYACMCVLYVILGSGWMIFSFMRWRELMRVQFWIGAVVLLGMVEKAVFCAQYQHVNTTGDAIATAVIMPEVLSCAKRTLARMLVIIVSLGLGIVKPRLGPLLPRVVFVGTLYFILATAEAILRVLPYSSVSPNQAFLASIPLSLLDAAICWWIFSALVHTTRNLRVRRNLVKLSLYRHFTHTLIFAVLASIAFMLWSIKTIKMPLCIRDWKELWVDQAYWHILFSMVLLVIMVLWRPTNNNNRYAFSPLLDNPEDDDDEENVIHDGFAEGMKLRSKISNSSPTLTSGHSRSSSNADEDLRWIEENIPSSLVDTALPILDSDEEIVTTKFELSKMQ